MAVKRLVPMLWGLLCFPSAALAQSVVCPDYPAALEPPTLQGPAQRGFRHWGSQWLSWSHRPYHMVHDQIVPAGEQAVIVGKFDYGSALHKDLEDEDVHVYIFGTGMADWQYLGEHRTNTDGKIHVPAAMPVGEYTVEMRVEGDLSGARGYLSVVDPGRQTILFDIDGTLTRDDFEIVGDYLGIGTARAHDFAIEVVNRYIDKGYQVVYLTGRPYWATKDTREWFDFQGILGWHLHTNPYGGGPIPPDTEGYKIDYLFYLLDEVGLDIVRAYGNADTDVSAYEVAGLPKHETYIIGEHAGVAGTQPIDGDYVDHFGAVVEPTPLADCIRGI